MTTNAIAYLRLLEDKRHNLAGEQETHRSNRASENIKSGELGEDIRHHQAQEAIDHNKVLASLINTKSVADTAEQERYLKNQISTADRNANIQIKEADRQSNERIAKANRENQAAIAKADREQRERESQRSASTSIYSSDMRYKGSVESAKISAAEKAADREQKYEFYNLENFGVPHLSLRGIANVPSNAIIDRDGIISVNGVPDFRATGEYWSRAQNLPLNYKQGEATKDATIMGTEVNLMRGISSLFPWSAIAK